MGKGSARLNSLQISKALKRGRYCDGHGLYLLVGTAGNKSWVFRYMLQGRMRDMGLGPYPEIGLAEAREKALECRRMRVNGIDPIDVRRQQRIDTRVKASRSVSFDQCADSYLDTHQKAWTNEKHIEQWLDPIRTYASPSIGKLPVAEVNTDLILQVLRPIWHRKPVMANRLRARIAQILDWAKTRGFREGDNPARWQGHLSNLLPAIQKFRQVKHHSSLPYKQISFFVRELRDQNGCAARALEFLILTATRTSETLGARWEEIDLENRIWTIPAGRIKTRKEHRIPLSEPAMRIALSCFKPDLIRISSGCANYCGGEGRVERCWNRHAL
jgi:hypothetical protein